jgi:isopentenyl-diphosphate delta-isomerase
MLGEWVVLVDEQDSVLGYMEKMEAHEKGLLHRAFSLFVFNKQGDMLLQRRAWGKYHSGGLWTNACCSHPRPNELVLAAATRRVQEEMGFECTPSFGFTFLYKAKLDKQLTEHELDHVLYSVYEGVVSPNPEEVCEWKYAPISAIREELMLSPESYTEWFKLVFERVVRGSGSFLPQH